MLSRPGTGKFQVAHLLTASLKRSVPQISRTAQTMIQGSSDIQTSAVVGFTFETAGAGRPSIEVSAVRSAAEVQITSGDHTLRNSTRQTIEISEAPISTIHGLMK